LGAAINGKCAGDSASYVTPNGSAVDVEIIDAHPYPGQAAS
jgi:transcription elongation factor GreA